MLGEDKKKILEMIAQKKITAEEGFKMYRQMASDSYPESKAVKDSTGNGSTEPVLSDCFGELSTDIAIIGMSGQFPQAENVEDYWSNLFEGRDCIIEAPKSRWDVDKIEDEGKKFIRYGGFLSDIDKFDPLFFNISPKEAEYMDPRQRLFLQESWKALEDAGYSNKELDGRKCSVFAGIQNGEYMERFLENAHVQMPTGNSLSVIPARISYLLNLKGPSIAVDSACSASLVAICMACESIHNGTSEMSIAGGVQMMLSPWLYMALGKTGMFNSDGKCKTFDNSANGIVPGEGVGAIILKRLEGALRDRDHIYGVIKGYGTNQDGKTNGITAPNGPSQTALECEIYNRYKINPENITYIETHGTGTKLGDPIEVNALTDAFRKYTGKKQYCNIGSVKTNIGHAISASGVASVIKVLLCLKNKEIPASLNLAKENELIDFKSSPFYVGTKNEAWNPTGDIPRMAAVSSFGMGGTNSHMVICEPKGLNSEDVSLPTKPWYMVPISAKTEDVLNRKVKDLLDWLKKDGRDKKISDISFTSLVGRSHFNVRALLVVRDKNELKEGLEAISAGRKTDNYLFNNITSSGTKPESSMKQLGKQLIAELSTRLSSGEYRQKLTSLADLYIKGYDFDWKKLYEAERYMRISMPTYPFEKVSCWKDKENESKEKASNESAIKDAIHPLLHRNTSSLKEIKFTTYLPPNAPYLSGKWVYGTKLVPEADLLEIARAAGEIVTERKAKKLENVQFTKPVTLNSSTQELRVNLFGDGDRIDYQISIPDKSAIAVYSKGTIVFEDGAETTEAYIDIDAIKKRSTQVKSSEECYLELENCGLKYEPSFRALKELYSGTDETLALLELPVGIKEEINNFTIHPILVEGALQAAAVGDVSPSLLYELSELEILKPLTEFCYAYVQKEDEVFNITFAGSNQEVLARAKSVRTAQADPSKGCNIQDNDLHYVMEKEWKPSQARGELIKPTGIFVVLANSETKPLLLESFKNGSFINSVVIRDETTYQKIGDREYCIDFKNAEHGNRLASEIFSVNEGICGVIDLSDLHSYPIEKSKGNFGRVALVQAIIMRCIMIENFHLLHFTSGLQPFMANHRTLAGAEFAGFVRILGAEYIRLNSKTIDIDLQINTEELKQIILKEINLHDPECEACYRDGIRYQPCMKTLICRDKWESKALTERFKLDTDRVVVITGGTRGVGGELAKHMVNRGARKLVLMGVQQYPPRNSWEAILNDPASDKGKVGRIKRVLELEKSGAKVEIYCGSLTDREKLDKFFKGIRQNLGEIGGVFHCAGININTNPAFIYKNTGDIRKVYEPKVEGLETLHEVFKADGLDFFILFSSISSQCPILSVALSDYGAANYFADCFASYQFAKGYTYYKSIVWPSWDEVGMLVDLGGKSSPVYTEMGLTAHKVADGFFMLDSAMSFKESPFIIPCLVKKDKFNPDSLLFVKQTEKPRTPEAKVNNNVQITVPSNDSVLINLRNKLKKVLSNELRIPESQINEETDFGELGVDSILLTELVKKFEDIFDRKLDPGLFLEYPNLKLLSEYMYVNIGVQDNSAVSEGKTEAGEVSQQDKESGIDLMSPFKRVLQAYSAPLGRANTVPAKAQGRPKIAVIGIACNFPKAKNKDIFWQNLAAGVSGITEVPKSRWDTSILYAPKYEKGKIISKWGGFIEDIEYFDAEYFGINGQDAPQLSPLVRLFLESSAQVIRDAGYEAKELEKKKIGVFVGAHAGTYPHRVTDVQKNTITGIGMNFIAAHVSHFFNFNGPSLVMDSACSSSLLSIHLACQSIMTGESEMAIAGGVDLLIDEKTYKIFNESRALSPDGKCHTFDENPNGIVPGEGCGALLLKPVDRAIKDGDQIYAVIEAAAANNDGRTMGITTPNAEAQADVIRGALLAGDINPRSISLVEAHGTGTMIGDPIELRALTKVFQQYTDDKQFCGVGSVKTNIGHALSAAGMASFIKVALSIYNKQLPPTLNCINPNPRFEFKNSPFYPNTSLKEWKPCEGTRRAGISAFGFGGTNVHIIAAECDPALLKAYAYNKRRSPLPPVVFNKKRYWVEKDGSVGNTEPKQEEQSFLLDFIEETL